MGVGKKHIFIIVIVGAIIVSIVMSSNSSVTENPVSQEDAVIDITPEGEVLPVAADSNERVYTVRMVSTWNDDLQPDFHPNGSHLSPMIAWSHTLKDSIFKSGEIASKGMEIMAETGAPKVLTGEIEEYLAGGDVRDHGILDYGVGEVFFTPGEEEVQVTVSRDAPYVTVVSMIAPSPDWFVSARNIKLYDQGKWLERILIPAPLYDAGTDDGEEFTSADKDTQPKQPIGRFAGAPSASIVIFEFIGN